MRYEVRLKDKSIYDIYRGMKVVDVTENEPKESVKTVAVAGGTRILDKRRESLTVEITLALRVENFEQRTNAYTNLLQWGREGGYLCIGDRPRQRLYIDSVKLPGLGSAKRWYDSIGISMTAYSRPWWESVAPVIARIKTPTTAGSAEIRPPGTAEECPADVEITATGSLNELRVQAGNTHMTFHSLGMSAGEKLVIDHSDDGTLRLRIGERSVFNRRTGESSDELMLKPGVSNEIQLSANGLCTAKISTRGRWL